MPCFSARSFNQLGTVTFLRTVRIVKVVGQVPHAERGTTNELVCGEAPISPPCSAVKFDNALMPVYEHVGASNLTHPF